MDTRAKIQHMREQVAWIRLSRILKDACQNEDIAPSRAAGRFVKFMSDAVAAAGRARNEAEASQILDAKLLSVHGRNIAYRRHSPNRPIEDWVVEEWMKEKDMYKSKKEFAEEFFIAIKEKYGKKIAARTIAEKWLKDL